MYRVVRMGLWAALAFATLGVAAQACERATVAGGTAYIDPTNINQAKLDRAIQLELNYQRCRLGLRQIAHEPKLQPVAERHSRWMARKQVVTHNSGRNTLRRRLNRSGVRWQTGAENIVKTALYKIEVPQGYRVVDSAACKFKTRDGKMIDRHTYNSLAIYAFELWMNSPGHRKHIADPRLKLAGTGAAFDPKVRHCGVIYITQNFAG